MMFAKRLHLYTYCNDAKVLTDHSSSGHLKAPGLCLCRMALSLGLVVGCKTTRSRGR